MTIHIFASVVRLLLSYSIITATKGSKRWKKNWKRKRKTEWFYCSRTTVFKFVWNRIVPVQMRTWSRLISFIHSFVCPLRFVDRIKPKYGIRNEPVFNTIFFLFCLFSFKFHFYNLQHNDRPLSNSFSTGPNEWKQCWWMKHK